VTIGILDNIVTAKKKGNVKKINNLEKNINIKNGNIYLVSIGQNIGNENYGNDFVDLKENFRIFLCN